jgi:SAM-dependent methyltransferase/CelD/BcsL family acetyltransferase involved in cellulose biosynthesis
VKGRLISVHDISVHDEQRWRDLADRAVEPNPLGEPDCVIPAARYQSFGDEISLLVAEEGDSFQACVPLRPTNRWYNIRYPIAANKVRRATYVGTPLVDPASGTEAVATMLTTLGDERRTLGCRLLGLDSLRAGGPVAHYLDAAAAELNLAVHVQEDFERAFWVRRPEPTYFDDLKASRRQSIRRRRRRLTKEFGIAPVLVDRSTDPCAIDDFVALEAAGYKTVNGVALATVPGEPEYFASMCKRFGESKRLQVIALECGDRTLAMQVSLRGGDGLFALKVAYNEDYRVFGPGALLHVESFDHIHHATDATWFDSCASADNTFLFDLYPDRTRIITALFSLDSPVDQLFVRSLPHVRRAHHRYRTFVEAHRATESHSATESDDTTESQPATAAGASSPHTGSRAEGLRTLARQGADVVARARGEILPPRRLLARTSSPSRWEFAAAGVTNLECCRQAGLRRDGSLLDIGSGVGRMALPLTGYLSAAGTYTGVDLWRDGVDWCTKAITPRFPGFTFRHLDLRHHDLNPSGSTPITAVRLPFDDGVFDVVTLVAINHLSADELLALVGEAGRVLRPGGTYVGTWFLVDETSEARLPAVYAAVACDEQTMDATLHRAGLRRRALHRGSWRGADGALSLQDVVIADKDAT